MLNMTRRNGGMSVSGAFTVSAGMITCLVRATDSFTEGGAGS